MSGRSFICARKVGPNSGRIVRPERGRGTRSPLEENRTLRFGALLLFAACVTPAPFVPTDPAIPPDVAGLACAAAGVKAQALLATDEFSRCEHDSDCAEVAPVVSGACGRFVNAATFEAHFDTFQAQTNECTQAVQLVPLCPRLRAQCVAGRCAGDSISELPDECESGKKALRTAAAAANTCAEDEECTLLEGDIVGTAAFAKATRTEQDGLARVCGSRAPVLHGMKQPPGAQAFCFERRCHSSADERAARLTTVVRSTSFTDPQFDQACFSRAFTEAFNLGKYRGARGSFQIQVNLRVDASARIGQFQFIKPSNLSEETRAALAHRLHECPALQPGRRRGKPVPVMVLYRFTFLAE